MKWACTVLVDAGDKDLFLNLEPILIQALPQEPTEWRRSFRRILGAVTLNAVFIPFSEDILQREDNYHLLKEPILHIFWTQCAVSIPIIQKHDNMFITYLIIVCGNECLNNKLFM